MSSLDVGITQIQTQSISAVIEQSEKNGVDLPFNKGLNSFFKKMQDLGKQFNFSLQDALKVKVNAKNKVVQDESESVAPSGLEGVLGNIQSASSYFKEVFLIKQADNNIKKSQTISKEKKEKRKASPT